MGLKNVGAMLDCARIGDARHEIHYSRHDPPLVTPDKCRYEPDKGRGVGIGILYLSVKCSFLRPEGHPAQSPLRFTPGRDLRPHHLRLTAPSVVKFRDWVCGGRAVSRWCLTQGRKEAKGAKCREAGLFFKPHGARERVRRPGGRRWSNQRFGPGAKQKGDE